MENHHELSAQALNKIDTSIRRACPTCKRGAADLSLPTVEDLEALTLIRDGFNDLRRQFSPAIEDRFRRFDKTISYLHTMIAGSHDGSL